MQCKRGAGRFQWNGGGWFGGQVGSTCWLLLAGVAFFGQAPALAALLFGCFALANLVGTIIWRNRDKIDPYRGIQALIGVLFVFAAIALVCMDYYGLLAGLDDRFENARVWYLVLLMYPGLMTMFHFQNRAKAAGAKTQS